MWISSINLVVIRTNAAASMLGVSTNTLRSWERRYAFPRPHRTDGGHRQYELHEIEALRQALAETHNVSSAVALAQPMPNGVDRVASGMHHDWPLRYPDLFSRTVDGWLSGTALPREIVQVGCRSGRPAAR